MTDHGALPSATGLSQAEPEVSALRASIPSAKTIAFTDEKGNRFIFPSWIIYPGDPGAPSASSLWWQAHAICSRLHNTTQEWIDFDPERFPHVRGEAWSGIFAHGAATTLLFAGPDFEAIASGIAARSDETPAAAQPEARARPDAQPLSGAPHS